MYATHDDLLHHIAHLSCTVAIEETVSVFAVLRSAVLDEIAKQPTCLALSQIQFLFGNARASLVIIYDKVFPRNGLHHVVRLAKHKVPDKVGLRHIEDTVVEDFVNTVLRHLKANGGMPVKGIDFLTWRTGEESHSYAVLLLSKTALEKAQYETKKYGQFLKHGRKVTKFSPNIIKTFAFFLRI